MWRGLNLKGEDVVEEFERGWFTWGFVALCRGSLEFGICWNGIGGDDAEVGWGNDFQQQQQGF